MIVKIILPRFALMHFRSAVDTAGLERSVKIIIDIYRPAADYIAEKLPSKPRCAVVLGSGFSFLAKELTGAVRIKYADIPGFPISTAPSHEGALYWGMLCGVPVYVFSGRFHCYEGYTMKQAAFYIGVLARLGVKRLVLTNAAGAVNKAFAPGNIMLVTDHIKFAAESPLAGEHDPIFGERFAPMTGAYDKDMADIMAACASKLGIKLHKGVYMYFAGPQYETPAEIRAAAVLGADAVGMSTVPEVIAAHAAGIKLTALSIITNMAAGLSDSAPNGGEVISAAETVYSRLSSLIKEFVKNTAVLGENNE